MALNYLLTWLAFPGVPNKNPDTDLSYHKRSPVDGDHIEYVHLETSGSTQLIFVSHGRLRNLDTTSVDQWRALAAEHGVSIVLRNYPGYGGTAGPVTMGRVHEDGLELAEALRGDQELVLFGNSLGCGPTLWLASRLTGVKKVVLVSPYASICALAPLWVVSIVLAKLRVRMSVPNELGHPERLRAWQKAGYDPVTPRAEVARLKGVSLLVLHGEEDDTIPITHSETLVREIQALGPERCVGVRFVRVAGEGHKYTRVIGAAATWAFICGRQEELEAEAKRLEGGEVTKPGHTEGHD